MTTAESYDHVMLAVAIWREARGESRDAKRAVAHVILNRIQDPRWPDSAVEVVTQPRQFSCFNAGDPNATKFPTPKRASDWAAWMECCSVVDELEADYDPTGGANHYHSLPAGAEPDWAMPDKLTLTVGRLQFYKL